MLGRLQHESQDDLIVLVGEAWPTLFHCAGETLADSLYDCWYCVVGEHAQDLDVAAAIWLECGVHIFQPSTMQCKVVQAFQRNLPRKHR